MWVRSFGFLILLNAISHHEEASGDNDRQLGQAQLQRLEDQQVPGAPGQARRGQTPALGWLPSTAGVCWVSPAPLPEDLMAPPPSLSLGHCVLLLTLPLPAGQFWASSSFPPERGSHVFIQPLVPVGELFPTGPPHWPVKPAYCRSLGPVLRGDIFATIICLPCSNSAQIFLRKIMPPSPSLHVI